MVFMVKNIRRKLYKKYGKLEPSKFCLIRNRYFITVKYILVVKKLPSCLIFVQHFFIDWPERKQIKMYILSNYLRMSFLCRQVYPNTSVRDLFYGRLEWQSVRVQECL